MALTTGNFSTKAISEFVPERLTEAREALALNLTDLAEKVGVTRQAISRYELGTLTPSAEVLGKITETLGQPLAFFFSARQATTLASGPAFFRSFKSATASSRRACLRQRQWLIDSYIHIEKYINFPKVDVQEFLQSPYSQEEIEEIANNCRQSWGLGDGPISNMIDLLESNGVVVARAELSNKKIDAFSFWFGERPFIFLGADKSSACRSRFDAAHELGHLILHGGITTEDLEEQPEILKRIEKEADSFASAFLLPASSFPAEIFSSRLSHFVELKKRWKVSIAAMIYRCSTLEIFHENQILNLRKQMSMQKMRTTEPLDDLIPIEAPSLLQKSFNLIIEHKIKTAYDFAQDIPLSSSVVSKLLNVGHDIFKQQYLAPVISLRSSSSIS